MGAIVILPFGGLQDVALTELLEYVGGAETPTSIDLENELEQVGLETVNEIDLIPDVE